MSFVGLIASGAFQLSREHVTTPNYPAPDVSAQDFPLAEDVSAEAAQLIAESRAEQNRVLRLESLKDLTELPRELLDMPHVAYLSIEGSAVEDLSLLAHMSQLKGVRLGYSKVIDLSPLAGLTELRVLEFQRTGVVDLSALAGLQLLKKVNASGSQVTDLAPLSELPHLENLNLDDTKVTDLSPLVGAVSLKKLSFRETGVTDIAALSGLPSLVLVQAQRSAVVDFRPALTWPAMQPFIERKGSRESGLWFAYSKAAEDDPKLDDIARGSTRMVLARLAQHYRADWPPASVEAEPVNN